MNILGFQRLGKGGAALYRRVAGGSVVAAFGNQVLNMPFIAQSGGIFSITRLVFAIVRGTPVGLKMAGAAALAGASSLLRHDQSDGDD